jgi:2-oxoglutarate ferredoxin oxidoreductase subunit beta
MSQDTRPSLPTDAPPHEPARQVASFRPNLLLHEDHDLCPGCGEPLAIRVLLEVIEELGLVERTLGVVGIGCYTAFTSSMEGHPRWPRAPSACGPRRRCSRCRATATW